jgi:Homeobox KN domain/Mating-type protein beta 1
MKATLREQVIRVEQQFLLSIISNDENSLQIFAQEWSQLANALKVDGKLNEDTALLLSQVSQVIDHIACCILESGAISNEAYSYSMGHFILNVPPDVQSGVSCRPQEIPPCHLLFPSLPSTKSGILGQQSLLDFYAHRWLMQNIHDPYPTSLQMQTMGDVSGTSVAQVELWFQEVRDAIGWTKLSHEFFAGSKGATIAAAQRVYLKGDMSLPFDVLFAFTSVKAYAETFFLEHPALQAEHATEDVPQNFQNLGTGLDSLSEKNLHAFSANNHSAPFDALSGLSVDEEDEEEDTTPPPSVAGCKRRLAEDVKMSQVSGLQRPEKRPRCVLLYQPFRLTEDHAR